MIAGRISRSKAPYPIDTILRRLVVRFTQMSMMFSPSGRPSSNGVHAPLGGVVPTAGVIVPRKAPTSVTAYTVLGSLGSKTAPLM